MNNDHGRRPVLRVVFRFMIALALILVLAGQSTPVKALMEPAQPGALLRLRTAEFDPLVQAAPDLPKLQDQYGAEGQPDLWLIQFPGPIQDAWLDAIRQHGLTIIHYVPDNAYLVWGDRAQLTRLNAQVSLRWSGEFRPEYALHPDLLNVVTGQQAAQAGGKSATAQAIVVQIAAPGGAGPDPQPILDGALAILHPPEQFRSVTILQLYFPVDRLAWLAAQPGVLDVSPLPRYHKLDEIQGQIMAGNLNPSGTGPNGAGYLDWLLSKGFSTNPEDYPIVDVTDDGIDDGDATPQHADFYKLGDRAQQDRLAYNQNWTTDPLADGRGGHGNLNASIVAGYNNLSGGAFQDPDGYRRGLGINPFGRIGGSKVFSNSAAWGLTDSLMALVETSYNLGARISTNSWGYSTYGMYTLEDEIYDLLARDANLAQPGNQELTLIFAAGNGGPTSGSIDSPASAKNVITVGASENYRPHREPVEGDRCSLAVSSAEQAASNIQEIADFSGRGPTDDGRIKPDLVAPGTTILGAASQAAGYWGEGICVRYYPAGQTLYAASSGTSHSAPAVAGTASLLYYHYQTRNAAPPSPAMVKAYMVNSARGLNGVSAGDNLPSPSQGFGLVDMGRMFDTTQRFLIDQSEVFHAPGDVFEASGRIFDSQEPLRVTLAWTDAPGSSISAAYVNDLDLEVVVDGQAYLGNVFSGQISQPGGVADFRNNVESVFLPAGLNTSFTVRVRAHNLAGDGVPGNADLTDQDFALVVYNADINIGALHGQVRLQPGDEPATGAFVWAIAADGRKLLAPVQEGGVYAIDLFPGAYTIGAWKYGYTAVEANPISVENGQDVTRDFDLTVAPVRTLHGCIRDQETGSGLVASLRLIAPTGRTLQEAGTTAADPCFEMELPEGKYRLLAGSRLHIEKEVEVDLSRDLEQDFELTAMTHDGLLLGQVIDSLTGAPLAAARVVVEPGGHQQLTNGAGRFELQLPAGEYRVTVAARFHPPIEHPQVEIRQSNQTEESFLLAASRLKWRTANQPRYSFQSAGASSFQVYLENSGDAQLFYTAAEYDRMIPVDGQTADSEYLVSDSRQTAAAAYQWLDARDGERFYLADAGVASVALPFPFEFYGSVYTSVLVSNDGAITFNLGYGGLPYENSPLGQFPDTLIAPYWDDLSGDTGYVAVKIFGVAPDRKFVIEWFDRSHWASAGKTTFEVILYEGSGNIKFQYQDVDFDDPSFDYGSSATVGIRSAGSQYLEYAHQQTGLQDGMALCFQAYGSAPCNRVDLSWLRVEPAEGTLAPGETTQLTVTMIADPNSPMGLLSGGISLYSNDPLRQPYIDLPVQVLLIYNGIYLPFFSLSVP